MSAMTLDDLQRLLWSYHTTEAGGGYDLVLLANILHQESVPHAAALVRRAADALNPDGLVAVVDFQIDAEQRQHPFGTLFAINMRSFGDTHTELTRRAGPSATPTTEGALCPIHTVICSSGRFLQPGVDRPAA